MTDTPDVALDLRRTHFTHPRGDVTVYGTWLLTNRRPCLVLLPSFTRIDSDYLVPCIIPMDQAYKWDEHTGDPAHCAQMTWWFAQALGIDAHNPSNMIRLTSIIREHLGDLLTMPPFPESQTEIVADTLMVNHETGRTTEATITEVSDHV